MYSLSPDKRLSILDDLNTIVFAKKEQEIKSSRVFQPYASKSASRTPSPVAGCGEGVEHDASKSASIEQNFCPVLFDSLEDAFPVSEGWVKREIDYSVPLYPIYPNFVVHDGRQSPEPKAHDDGNFYSYKAADNLALQNGARLKSDEARRRYMQCSYPDKIQCPCLIKETRYRTSYGDDMLRASYQCDICRPRLF